MTGKDCTVVELVNIGTFFVGLGTIVSMLAVVPTMVSWLSTIFSTNFAD